MTISIRKFEIGKEYRRNNDGKNMNAIPFNYVVTARTECTVTLLEVNINGGFRFELERNICKDCNGYEYALISENEGNIRADGIPSISHLVHERDNELREIIAENAGKYPTVETFTEKKTFEEIQKAERNMSVFLVMKDNYVQGKITARHNKYHMVSHVAFVMFGNSIPLGKSFAASTTVKGYGFNREDYGINEILSENADALREYYGLDFPADSSTLMRDNWAEIFSNAGYQLIRAL